MKNWYHMSPLQKRAAIAKAMYEMRYSNPTQQTEKKNDNNTTKKQ